MSKKKPANTSKPQNVESNFYYWCCVVFIGIVFSLVHSIYIYNLFENDRFFSHLSDLEREMSYRTEMGLYFSFYKTIVQAPDFLSGIQNIINDERTEAGHTINAFKRFNIYPEVLIGGFFRVFKYFSKTFKWSNEVCYQVNRGYDLPPIQSCEGIGNLHYFYVYSVFGIAGTVLGFVFLMGTLLSGTIFGGLISAFAFIFNHGHATRVQWTPPLRESFGFPIFFWQLTLLTVMLKNKQASFWQLLSFGFSSFLFILSWQFSGFALFTQVVCLAVTFSLGLVPRNLMKKILHAYLLCFVISYLALFGNTLLISSLFFTSLIGLYIIVSFNFHSSFKLIKLFLEVSIFLVITVGTKYLISRALNNQDDDHIFDILQSKFTDYSTFHTKLYTCAAEFDFIGFETIFALTWTYLLPLACVSLGVTTFFVLFKVLWDPNQVQQAHVVYHAGQLVIFFIMATLIMRLKLFAVPQLCVFSAVFLNKELIYIIYGKEIKMRSVIAVLIIAAMAYEGSNNVAKQIGQKGEYNNEAQEYLFHWIEQNTHKDAVFAGSMPLMANIKLSTGRKTFNHPHYEDAGLRARTMTVYSLYSRKNHVQVYKTLKAAGIEYFVFESHLCGAHRNKECTYLGLWDSVNPENKAKPSICSRFTPVFESGNNLENISPFVIAYQSPNYVVLKL